VGRPTLQHTKEQFLSSADYRRRRASRSDSSRVRMSPAPVQSGRREALGTGTRREGLLHLCCATPFLSRFLLPSRERSSPVPPPQTAPKITSTTLTLTDGALDVPHDEAVLVIQELDTDLGDLCLGCVCMQPISMYVSV